MKLTSDRNEIVAPLDVQEAMFTIGHWLAQINAPDLDGSFYITENRHSNEQAEIVTYLIQLKQVKRHKWLVEGEA